MEQTLKLNTDGADVALKISKILKKLITCLTQETLALQSHNRDIANKMNQEKTLLMHNYKSIQAHLAETPELFKNSDSDVKKHLQDITAEFETVLDDNVMAIQSGRNAVSRLIKRIIKKARQAASTSPQAYDANGYTIADNIKAPMMPTKLNETF